MKQKANTNAVKSNNLNEGWKLSPSPSHSPFPFGKGAFGKLQFPSVKQK